MAETETQNTPSDDSGYPRIEDQIRWYSKSSRVAQSRFRAFKILQILVAAAVPVAALYDPTNALVPGSLGAVLLVLEGLQELGNYRNNWQKYRGTGENLKQEKYMYMAMAGPYAEMDSTQARRALAERAEAIMSEEHAKWVSQFSKTEDKKQP